MSTTTPTMTTTTTTTTTAARTAPTTAKVRALRALRLPSPRVICDNGDNTTYHKIMVTSEMDAWIQRHPEATVPDLGKTRPTATGWRYGILRRMADHRRRALAPSYAHKNAALRKYRETLVSVIRAPFRPKLP